MESNIKVKATAEKMSIFCDLYCVKRCDYVKWLDDGKRRNLYNVTLRHADDAGELKGTYTVETLMKRFRSQGDTNLAGSLARDLRLVEEYLAVIGDKDRLTDVINEALKRRGLKLKVA